MEIIDEFPLTSLRNHRMGFVGASSRAFVNLTIQRVPVMWQ